MTQPVPYGMIPGQRHELPGITVPNAPPPPDDINLDAPTPAAPYGMQPGVRHVLPGITRLPPPEAQAPELDPAQQPKFFGQYGIEVADPETGKKMVFHSNLEDSLQNRGKSIAALGKALMDHAHTDAEKAAAERAAAWGVAQVDTDVPLEHVIQSMDGSYRKDTGYEAALSKQTLANQGKLDAIHARFPGGGIGGGPNLKQDKFDLQESQGQTADLEKLVEAERKNYDFKANQATQQATQKMLAMMNSGNALAQRVAVMQELKELTGKQQTAREQAAIANAAGVMEAWMNDWALKIPGADPQLSESYRRKFIEALQIAQQTAQQTMSDLGESGVNALRTAPFYQRMSPEERQMAETHVKGRLSGKFDVPQATEQQPKVPAKKYNIGDIVK